MNKKIISFLFFVFASFVCTSVFATEIILSPTKPSTTTKVTSGSLTYLYVFSQNLNIGSYNKDVMALKKIISLEFGSKLDTSASFTSTTANDVKKLQEKYAIDILIPNGLSAGTGTVGPSTIKKLNQLAIKYGLKTTDFVVPALSTIKTYFTTLLKIGSKGNDVLLLKMVLNSDKDTKISGSPYNITDIFDKATETALIKFQEKYAKEILMPSGLTKGTGTTGPATRKKLDAILNTILKNIPNFNESSTDSYQGLFKTINPGSTYSVDSSTGDYSIKTNGNASDSNTSNSQNNNSGTGENSSYVQLYNPEENNTGSFGYTTSGSNSSDSNNYLFAQYGQNNQSSDDLPKKIISFSFPSSIDNEIFVNDYTSEINIYTKPLLTYRGVIVPDSSNSLFGMAFSVGSKMKGMPVSLAKDNLSSIAPTIKFEGQSISPASGVAQDFTKPVKYTITASDGTKRTYTINVAPVTCINYFDKGIPIGGKITNTKKVHITAGTGLAGLVRPPLGLPAYMISVVQEKDTSSASQKMVNKYCPLPYESQYVVLSKPKSDYFLGYGSAYPTLQVNTCPNGVNDFAGGCYKNVKFLLLSGS